MLWTVLAWCRFEGIEAEAGCGGPDEGKPAHHGKGRTPPGRRARFTQIGGHVFSGTMSAYRLTGPFALMSLIGIGLRACDVELVAWVRKPCFVVQRLKHGESRASRLGGDAKI